MRSVQELESISNGTLYDIDDRVKAGTSGCKGCSACCHHVGDLVVLTPFDVYEIKKHLHVDFKSLLKNQLELREKNKILLPHLKMIGSEKKCSFLNQAGRCAIHAHRPNICRLFPLGRIYEQDNFKYFLQSNSCTKGTLDEVSVREWIGINDYDNNKAFVLTWHQLIKALIFRMKFIYEEADLAHMNDVLLENFYGEHLSYDEDFYKQFYDILPKIKRELGIL